MPRVYERLGGARAFEVAVDDFYQRVTGDPELRPFFAHTDLQRLKAHQRAFLGMALGGPRAYLGRGMHTAHASLSVTEEAFDRVLDHLVGTLLDLGVPSELIREVGDTLLPLRGDIVATSSVPSYPPPPPGWSPDGAPRPPRQPGASTSLFAPDPANASRLPAG